MIIPFYFAHHPLCSNYRREIIQIGSCYLCRGCFFVYLSTIISSLVTLLLNPFREFSVFEGVLLVIIITSPTWFAFLFTTHNRVIKDIFRISLGLGWGISIAETLIRPELSDKLIILTFIVTFYLTFRFLRSRRKTKRKDPLCSVCPENKDDVCSGFQRQMEVERLFSAELSDYLQSRLSWDDIKETID